MTPDSSLLMSSSAFSRRDIASTACSCSLSTSRHSSVLDHAAQGAVEQPECLQRLAQIVARGGEKAALGERGMFGFAARVAHRLFHLPPFGDVANRGRDDVLVALADRTQADLDRELAAVLAPAKQVQSHAHGPHAHVARVAVAVRRVPRAKAFGQQHLDLGCR